MKSIIFLLVFAFAVVTTIIMLPIMACYVLKEGPSWLIGETIPVTISSLLLFAWLANALYVTCEAAQKELDERKADRDLMDEAKTPTETK